MAEFTVVFCDLADCLYYTPEPTSPRKCRCTHPDKPIVMDQFKCPLYRMNWGKIAGTLGPSAEKKKPQKKYGEAD